jgi:hypothetical protein
MSNSFISAFGSSGGGGSDATKLPLAGGTLTGQLIQSTNGAASTPPMLLNGTIFTGGTGTTTMPHWLIQPTGATAATGWSTSGTAFGINLDAASGNFTDFRVDGAIKVSVANNGSITTEGSLIAGTGYVRAGNIYANSTANILELYNDSCAMAIGADATAAVIRRGGAYCLQLGTDAAGVTNQHFKACNRITSNGAGANLTVSGGNCRGTTGEGGVGGSLILATYAASVSSNTVGTLTTRLTINTLGEIIPVLPTSSAGLTTGALWNDTGTVKVA